MTARFCAILLPICLLLTACDNGGEKQVLSGADATVADGHIIEVNAPKDMRDSLAYFYGAATGVRFAHSSPAIPEGHEAYEFDRHAFLKGIRDVVSADTMPAGFHDGVERGLQFAVKINGMASNGISVDRQKFLERFAGVITRNELPDDATRMESRRTVSEAERRDRQMSYDKLREQRRNNKLNRPAHKPNE